ncbi:MAG TPA: hypothetical protein VN915_08950 [Elusimicrobiota bacterium]|nr:hypothetical protein [Elusimicrobiota bacterium]
MGFGTGSAARFAGAGALFLFLCWQHVEATRLGYRVEAARRETMSRRGRVAALRVELDERLSPEQVAARAERLGLVPAAPDALRRLPETSGDAAPLGGLTRILTRGFAPLVAATRS